MPHVYVAALPLCLWVVDASMFLALLLETLEPIPHWFKQQFFGFVGRFKRPSPTSPEPPQTPASPPPLTLENCPRYLVIDPVFRDRIPIEATRYLIRKRWRIFGLEVQYRRNPKDAALAVAKAMRWLPSSHGWDTRLEYSAKLVARYDERWAVVNVITHSYRNTLTGGSRTESTHEETLTLWVRVDEPVEQVAEAI